MKTSSICCGVRSACGLPQGAGADEALGVPDGEDKGGDIGERIPANGERADREGDRIDIGEVDHARPKLGPGRSSVKQFGLELHRSPSLLAKIGALP